MTRQTSIDAYNKIKADGLLNGRRMQVYETLFAHGPLTARQVWRMVDPEAPTGGITTRLSELRERTCVAEVGKVIEPETGHEVILWDVTPWLPVEPPYLCSPKACQEIGDATAQTHHNIVDDAKQLFNDEFNAGVDAAKAAAVKFLVGRVIGYAGRIDLEKELEALKR